MKKPTWKYLGLGGAVIVVIALVVISLAAIGAGSGNDFRLHITRWTVMSLR
jgi:hypothetical protein